MASTLYSHTYKVVLKCIMASTPNRVGYACFRFNRVAIHWPLANFIIGHIPLSPKLTHYQHKTSSCKTEYKTQKLEPTLQTLFSWNHGLWSNIGSFTFVLLSPKHKLMQSCNTQLFICFPHYLEHSLSCSCKCPGISVGKLIFSHGSLTGPKNKLQSIWFYLGCLEIIIL